MWCQSARAVHRPNGTRARNVPSRIAPAPLRNHQIAFGCGRFPVRCISHRCVPLKGAVGRAVGTGARRFSARLHSATANPPSSARVNPSAATARLAWSRCLPAPIASVPAASCPSRRRIRSGPVAGTPLPCALSAHVRFCGARSARLTMSKVCAPHLDCAETTLDISSVWPCLRMAKS